MNWVNYSMEIRRTAVNERTWQIELLGGLRAWRGEQILSHFQTQKTAALLAYLARYSSERHLRERLIDLLWPDAESQAGRNRLSQALSWLRPHLETAPDQHGDVLLADRYHIGLNPVRIVTDVGRFEAAVQAVEQAPTAEQVAALQHAVVLGEGEFLPGYYDDWILEERSRLQRLWIGVARRLVDGYEQNRDWEAALDLAHRLLTADPLDEGGHLTYARLLAETGQTTAALNHLRRWERTLAQDFGETPSQELHALIAQIRQQAAAPRAMLSRSVSAISSHSLAPTPAPTLPTTLTRFFGRETEIGRIETLLREGARLVTITGLGGAGKTRLALEAASHLSGTFPQAIWFAPLADLSRSDHILDRLADQIRLSSLTSAASSADLKAQVLEAFASRPSLLILDNMEHLMPDVAQTVRDLLAGAPPLRVLVTSRQVLGLEGEQELPLPPLSVPGPTVLPTIGPSIGPSIGSTSGSNIGESIPSNASQSNISLSHSPEIDVDALMQIESVRLFLDRAQSTRPSFQITVRNARDVAQLCARLEGLPLALELCAAWAQTLSPAQMLAQLARRFDLLVSRRSDIAPRHRTLRAALEYSYLLLPPDLQQFFVRLSVFRGGWTPEAAQTVCLEPPADSDLSSSRPAPAHAAASESQAILMPVLTALTELRERSLVLAEEEPEGTIRFRLLETLREFALEQQTVAVETEIRRRHAGYFLYLAETARPQLAGTQQREWLRRLETEHDNFRLALEWSTATGSVAAGLRLGIALTPFWDTRGYAGEGQEWLSRLLGLPHSEPADQDAHRLRAHALNSCALLLRSLTRFAEAERYAADALDLWEELGDTRGRTVSLQLAATLAYSREDYRQARRLVEEALALAEQNGDRAGAAGARTNLGNIALEESRWDDAWELFSASLQQHQADGNIKRAADTLNNLGLTARYRGDLPAARRLLEDSLTICRDLADKSGTAITLLNLGAVARLEGTFAEAHTALQEAAQLAFEADTRRALAWCVRERGHLACAEQDFENGLRLLHAAENLRTALGMSFNPADPNELKRSLAAARTSLGDAVFATRWTALGGVSADAAYRFAIDLLHIVQAPSETTR